MKVKSLVSAVALAAAVTLSASPSFAEMQLTEAQLDTVTAGYEFGPFITTIADVNTGYPDTFNILNPYFAPGTPVIYFAPLGGPLF